MGTHHFAKPYYVNDYLEAADKNKLGWQILPAIAVVESSGCVHLLRNNCFGWNSARTGFRSIPEGISFVAQQLASGKYYANKTLKQKLHAYNSANPNYYNEIINLINQIK